MRQKDEHPFVAFYLLCGGVVLFVDCKKYDIKWISIEITNSLFCVSIEGKTILSRLVMEIFSNKRIVKL